MKIVGQEQKAQRTQVVSKADHRPKPELMDSNNTYIVRNTKLEVGTARQPASLSMWVVREVQGNEIDLEPTTVAYCTSYKQATQLVSKIGGYIT